MNEFWNSRYGQTDYVYGKLPNAFLKEQLKDLKSGKILFPAEGEGRNAVYAAALGWQVYAFDFSDSGQKKALDLAAELHVNIDYEINSYQEFDTKEQFDAIALIYTHMPSDVRAVFFRKLIGWLKPGGRIILEVFTPDQLQNSSGGPKDVDMLSTIKEIRNHFQALNEIIGEELEIELEEGAYHIGKANVVRFVGQKP